MVVSQNRCKIKKMDRSRYYRVAMLHINWQRAYTHLCSTDDGGVVLRSEGVL
jgi:hypothetical protein